MFYCKDAFEGLATMDALMNAEAAPAAARAQPPRSRDGVGPRRKPARRRSRRQPERSDVRPAPRIPTPPGWGPRVVREMPLEMVFKHLAINELFRLSWGAKNTHGEAWEKLEAEFRQRLERMTPPGDAAKAGCSPQAVYGYWPCQADGNDLVVYEPESLDSRPARKSCCASTSRASLPAITCAWPITLPRSNRARWMWSPCRW